jgi:hypothetical protein
MYLLKRTIHSWRLNGCELTHLIVIFNPVIVWTWNNQHIGTSQRDVSSSFFLRGQEYVLYSHYGDNFENRVKLLTKPSVLILCSTWFFVPLVTSGPLEWITSSPNNECHKDDYKVIRFTDHHDWTIFFLGDITT